MNLRFALGLLGAMVLAACGPAGTLTGKVTVEGGSASGIAIIVYGPQSAATVTKDDGTFAVDKLPDGAYVVKATLRGADVEEASGTTTLTQGKGSEVTLNFKFSTSKITGKVVFADGANPQNLTVNAVGPETRGARTAADGSFTFENVKTGAYLVSVEAADTKEGRVAMGVFASGPVDTGELRLTPVGRVGGIVTFNSMPAEGVEVTVPGSSLAAVTDSAGRYLLEGVPTGMQTIRARTGSEPFFRSGTATITVVRGANPDAPITMTDDPPPTGTVTGVITFRGPRSPRDISITAPGSGVVANAGTNGSFSLTLPVGAWDIVASAPSHPPKNLGRVVVNAGQVQSIVGQELSWWKPIWTSTAPSISGPGSSYSTTETTNWNYIYFNEGALLRFGVFNSQTYDMRLLHTGNLNMVDVSRLGKYVAWAVNTAVYVYETGTGAMNYFNVPNANVVGSLLFSTDESTLFVVRSMMGGRTLTRIPLASPTTQVTFPATGGATDVQAQSRDRWFVRETTDVRLVTTTTDVAQVFTQVSVFSTTPTAWALTNCGATCTLKVLSPTSTTAATDSSVTPTTVNLTSFNNLGLESRADYPCFTLTGAAFCVRSSDGTHYPLVAVPTNFRLNEAGDRVIFTYASGMNSVVREEAMPPQSATLNLGSNTVGWRIGWMSPTRAYAFEISGTPRILHTVKAGTVTTNNDVGSQSIANAGPLLVFPQASTSKWAAMLGDGPQRALEVATNQPVTGISARALGTGPVTKYGAVSFDATSMWIIDEAAMAVRNVFVGSVSGGAQRSGSVEFVQFSRNGGNAATYLFTAGTYVESNEAGVSLTAFAGSYASTLVALGQSLDGRTINVGSFQP